MAVHPDDIVWAGLVIEREAQAGRPFRLVVGDTPEARALAAELLALPLDEFLARCRSIRDRYETPKVRRAR